jgi:hypothetical protein
MILRSDMLSSARSTDFNVILFNNIFRYGENPLFARVHPFFTYKAIVTELFRGMVLLEATITNLFVSTDPSKHVQH